MRINFYGGPGVGKSTTAANIFSDLKLLKYSVEHVSEYIESGAYRGHVPAKFGQICILGKQMEYEYHFLKSGIKHIVSGSPLLLSYIYAPTELKQPILSLVEAYEKDFPAVNIFLDRGSKPYVQESRFQNEAEARAFDDKIHDMLLYSSSSFSVFPFYEYQAILGFVKSRLGAA